MKNKNRMHLQDENNSLYELAALLDIAINEEQSFEFLSKELQKVGAIVKNMDKVFKIQLSYDIKGYIHEKAVFISLFFEAPRLQVAKIAEHLRVVKSILRVRIFRYSDRRKMYKKTETLKNCISEGGRILGRSVLHLTDAPYSHRFQKTVSNNIKIARELSLLPYLKRD